MANRDFQSAREIMDPKMVFIDGLATAKEAVDTMRQEKVDSLIVNKRTDKDAYGIVRINDLINGVIIPDRTSMEVNVYEIMVKPVLTIPADMDVRFVASLFMRLNLWEAPVEERGELLGMISLSTIILKNALF